MKGALYGAEELREAYQKEARLAMEKLIQSHPEIAEEELEIDLAEVFRALYRGKSDSVTDAEIADTAISFRLFSIQKLKLFPGARETLAQLRTMGKRVYLLTNAQSLFTRPELCWLELSQLFDDIFISSEQSVKKPSARFYEEILAKHRLLRSQTVMVGNDAVCDCFGAAGVGLDSVYLHTEQSGDRPTRLPQNCTELHAITELLPDARDLSNLPRS
jgi:putative hydrolase of the HAD superfamily